MSNKRETVLELLRVFNNDAFEFKIARKRSKFIHRTDDIKAAGDEVEKTVRSFFRNKLPNAYYTGHGHIVDSNLKTSSQLDVIISDSNHVPILFETENGTEYIPFESVYAFAEVKSTYYKDKKPIHNFVEVIDNVKNGLQRDKLPPTFFAEGSKYGIKPGRNLNAPYNNPLFTFMVFVNSNDFTIREITEHVSSLYNESENHELPSCICFLDKGLIVNCKVNINPGKANTLGEISIFPQFTKQGQNTKWAFSPFGRDEETGAESGAHIGHLLYMLYDAIGTIQLKQPDLLKYFYGSTKSLKGGRVITPMNQIT